VVDDELAEVLRWRPLTTREAVAMGIARGRLRQAGIAHPFHGVVALRPDDRLAAIAARLDAHQFLSHATAAAVWGVALPQRLQDGALHVSTTVPHNAPRIAGVVGHRLDERQVDTTMVDGMRVTTPTETWRHLSTLLPIDDLVVAGDSLLRRRDPLASQAEMLRALARHGGKRGVRRLRMAHRLIRLGTDSPAETRLRLLIGRAGLPEPVVNLRIELPGYGIAFADLAFPQKRVAVEYDGAQHRVDARQFERDVLRLEAFAAAEWRVIRVLASHLRRPDAVIARIHAALARE
jgi:very-short-patch-repair endonuclease